MFEDIGNDPIYSASMKTEVGASELMKPRGRCDIECL